MHPRCWTHNCQDIGKTGTQKATNHLRHSCIGKQSNRLVVIGCRKKRLGDGVLIFSTGVVKRYNRRKFDLVPDALLLAHANHINIKKNVKVISEVDNRYKKETNHNRSKTTLTKRTFK